MPEDTAPATPAALTTLAQTAATSESLAATSTAATNVASQTAEKPVEKPISQMTKEERDSAVAAKLQERKAASAVEKSKETLAAAQEAAAEPVAEAPAAATTEPGEPKPEPASPIPPEEDAAAARLLKLARDTQRLAEERRRFREEKQREKAAAEASRAAQAAAQERLAKIEQARTSGNELQLLRAAGLSDEEIRGPLVVNLLDQLKKEEEAATGAPAQPGLTREQVEEIVATQQQSLQRLLAERQQQELQADITRDRNVFFSQVGQEFKTNQYPLVAAVKPTHAELDAHFVTHFQETGERLTAAQLLGAFEARYKEQGLTVVSKPKPGQKPAKPVTAATSRTIGARATSDAGDITPPTEPKKARTAFEIREEGKAKALAFLEAKHAARGR